MNKVTYICFLLITLTCLQLNAQQHMLIAGGQVKLTGNTNLVLRNTQLTNNASFNTGTSRISFKGTTTDSISGSSKTVFHQLVVNKSAGTLVLGNDCQINDTLYFQNGPIELNGFDLLLGTTGGTLEGESGVSYLTGINGGEVVKTLDLNAPTGENPGNIGVEISSVANLGTTTVRRGHIAQLINGQEKIHRYYGISPINNTGLNADVRFSYLDHELNGIDETLLAPFRFDNPNWTGFPVSIRDMAANYVEAQSLDSFSRWTLAEPIGAFPIEFLHFQATKTADEQAMLTWQTANEQNNEYFTIERSADGQLFEAIEFVPGAGNSTGPHNYETLDMNPLPGLNYYRIKQTDFNGSVSYSEVRSVLLDPLTDIQVKIFPNPTSDELNILVRGEKQPDAFYLYDTSGKQVLQKDINPNSNHYLLRLGELSAGAYFLLISFRGEAITQRIIVK